MGMKAEAGHAWGEPWEAAREQLAADIARWTTEGDRPATSVPGLALYRKDAATETACTLYEPAVVLVAQGRKRVMLGEEAYVYDARRLLITSLDLPALGQVIEASREKPCLALKLKLDRRTIAELMVDSNLPPPRAGRAGRAMAVGEVTLALLDAFRRLVGLLDEPEDVPILAPLLQREIHYRLLLGDQGARLRQMGSFGGQGHQIAKAIEWLKTNFAQPLRVDDLAESVQMSASSFHHHFRELTAMSPLQYQKWLRLSEARRLMLTDRQDASTAAFQVGYESPSQFSREYSRLFGAPPLRDITRLREAAMTGAA